MPRVHPYVWMAGAAALALYLITRQGAARQAGQATGAAAVDLAAGVFEGATYAAGDALGVPRTDPDKCAAAKASGDLWAASFACPAGDFLGAVLDTVTRDDPPPYTGGVTGSW